MTHSHTACLQVLASRSPGHLPEDWRSSGMFRASARGWGSSRREALNPRAGGDGSGVQAARWCPRSRVPPCQWPGPAGPQASLARLDQPWPERAPPSPRGSGPWLPLAGRTQKAKQTLDWLLTAGNNYKVLHKPHQEAALAENRVGLKKEDPFMKGQASNDFYTVSKGWHLLPTDRGRSCAPMDSEPCSFGEIN